MHAYNANTHVYTLFSLSDAQSLHGRQDERILHELKEWHNNFISVQHFMDDLAVAKGRIRSIQEEVAKKMQLAHTHMYSQVHEIAV